MKIPEIARFPTTVDKIGPEFNNIKVHESLFRAFQILGKIKYYLEIGTPSEVILELIDLMENPGDWENE